MYDRIDWQRFELDLERKKSDNFSQTKDIYSRSIQPLLLTMKTPPSCDCCERLRRPSRELHLHREIQDTGTDAWKRLLDEIEYVAVQELEVYAPGQTLDREEWQSIVTLPASIAKLKSVKRLILCGSSLVRLPPAISEMSALYEFDAYMSYRLHWLPYEPGARI